MKDRAALPTTFNEERRSGSESGFASIDALVALTILSLSLALCLRASQIARHVVDQARETAHAEVLMRRVLDSTDPHPGAATGRQDGFQWDYSSVIAPVPHALASGEVCAREVRLRVLKSNRSFSLSTLTGCEQ